MRDEVPPINLVASRIPRDVFEATYGIALPQPMEGEDPDRPPTSEELLNSYGCKRLHIASFVIMSALHFVPLNTVCTYAYMTR